MVESNNQQVNTFLKGMNLDLSNALLPEDSYREAYNLRISTDQNSNSGTLHNIEGVKFDMNFVIPNRANWTVLNTSTIRDFGLIVARHNSTKNITIFRFKHGKENTTAFKQVLGGSGGIVMPLGDNLSIVTRYEDDDNIKMYIADGINPIRSFNVSPANDSFNGGLTNDNSASIYPAITFDKPVFLGLGNGSLNAGVVQYGYQLFNKNGSETEVSPLTDLIYIAGGPAVPDKSIQAVGLPAGKPSSKSVKLKVKISDIRSYTRIKFIGIYYENRADIPKIHVLHDQKIPSSGVAFYEDKTGKGISEMTLEEFQMTTNVHFSPAILESKNNYLFASRVKYTDSALLDVEYDARAYRFYQTSTSNPATNVAVLYNGGTDTYITASQTSLVSGSTEIPEDHDCINPYNNTKIAQGLFHKFNYDQLPEADKARYDLYPCATYVNSSGQTVYGGIGKNVEYTFIVGDLTESEGRNIDDNQISHQRSPLCEVSKTRFEGLWVSNVTKAGAFVNSRLIKVDDTPSTIVPNYSSSVISHYFRSLQRDEVYRYGVVFYDKFGQASDVKWIGDIRTPSMNNIGFETFASNRRVAYTANVSTSKVVELAVRPIGITFKLSNIPAGVVSYEIVRSERTAENRSILSQGLVYKLMEGSSEHSEQHRNKVYPPVFPACSDTYNQGGQQPATVWDGWVNPYYGFVSPEVTYTKDSFEQLVNGVNAKVEIKKMVSSILPGTGNRTRVAVTPSEISGEVIASPGWDHHWSITNDDKTDSSYFVFKYYTQSNKYYSTNATSPQIGESVWAGNEAAISDVTAAKDIPWSSYDTKDDYLEPFSTTLYRNWVLMSLTATDGSDEGPNGRTFVFSSPILERRNVGGNVAKALDWNRSTNSGINSAFDYNGNVSTSMAMQTKAGLLLCNIKQDVIPYGGDDYANRQFATYMSCNGFNNTPRTNSTTDVFGGDTFIGVFDWCKTHYMTSVNNKAYNAPVFVYVPVESSINLALTHGPEYHRLFSRYVQCEPGNINNKYVQETPLYAYNTAYSSQSNAKIYTPLNEMDETNKVVDIRTYHSEPKTNDETIDAWTKFKPLNYLDVDTRYGKITNLRSFGNELIFWQEHALGKFSVLERSMITDDNNTPLLLGTGGVLGRYDYVATSNGMMDGHNDCDSQSDTVLYWFDQAKQEVCAYSSNSTDQISKSRYVHSYVRRLCIENNKLRTRPFVSYDKFYNELLCFLSTDDTLVYNEKLGVFTGFYTLIPDYTLMFGREMYMLKDNSLYKYNSNTINLDFNGDSLPIEFKWVVNKDYVHTKVFDNVDFSGLLNRENITKVIFNTETMVGRDITPADITDREFNYRFAVPRLKTNATYPNRLRGKYLECRMVYNLVGQANVLLVSHVDEYLNTYDDKQLIANKPAKGGTQVTRDLNYYTIDSSLTETFELPYIRTTYRVSKS